MGDTELKSLRESLGVIDQWRRAHAGTYTDWLNGSWADMKNVQVKEFDVTQLRQLAHHGHSAEITISAGFQARVTIDPPGAVVANISSGDLLSTFSEEQLSDVEAAYSEGRGEDFLRLCGELQCSIRLTVRVQPQAYGFSWIRTPAALVNPGAQGTWWDTIQALFRAPTVNRLIVETAGSEWLTAGGIAVYGPDAEPRQPSGYDAGPWQVYRKAWLADDRQTLPPPPAVRPADHHGLDSIAEFLSQASHALCWIWLATSAQIAAARFVITFEHGSYLEVEFTHLPQTAGIEDAIKLSDWSTASPDHMRHDAVENAVSAVVPGPGALIGSARRVLHTAKVLLGLAQSGAVAEALASRRAAVQAAVDAARASSDAARSAARSNSDRVFAEIAAGVGIILANSGSLINVVLAHWLILLVAALAIVTGVTAYAFEYPAAGHILQSYEKDLNALGVVLTPEDVEDIKSMDSLKQARSDLGRAQMTTAILLLATFIALFVGWIVVK